MEPDSENATSAEPGIAEIPRVEGRTRRLWRVIDVLNRTSTTPLYQSLGRAGGGEPDFSAYFLYSRLAKPGDESEVGAPEAAPTLACGVRQCQTT